jgi:hypothetical protein
MLGAGPDREVYRLDSRRLPLAKGRARWRLSVKLALAASVAVAALAADAGSLKAALDVTFWVAVVALLLAPFALWSAGRRVRQSWNAFELSMGGDVLAVATPHRRKTTIRRDHIVAIAERRGGLLVQAAGDDGQRRVYIPADVEGYRDLRGRLARWRPIVRRRTAGVPWAAFVLALIAAGGTALTLAVPTPSLAAAGVTLVTALGAAAIIDAALHSALGLGLKVAYIATVATGLAILWIQVARRMG